MLTSNALARATNGDAAVGRVGFIRDHGLWSEAQAAGAHELVRRLDGLRTVRVSWADQHGLVRGKTLPVDVFRSVLRNGMRVNTGPVIMDTGSAIAFNPFMPGGGFDSLDMEGCPDVVCVPDPSTFRVLPWADRTGWVLCDMYFQNGTPFPYSSRAILKNAVAELDRRNLDCLIGVELEWTLTKLIDPKLSPSSLGAPGAPGEPPEVEAVTAGYQYQSEVNADLIAPLMDTLLEQLAGAGLPLRSLEDEWGPSQMEFTFDPQSALEAADTVLLFRSAVRQICRRHGYHATFMCRPGLPGFFSSGWHLHQSLVDRVSGVNAFAAMDGEAELTPLGLRYVAGLLEHAREASAFVIPTVNGYKRLQPYSLAPDRCQWGTENRGSMIRVTGGPGDPTTHLENRAGEPAANPYLYIASQVFAGLDGIDRGLDPGRPTDNPYEHDAQTLPKSLAEAVDELDGSELYRRTMGDAFVDYIVGLKRSEVGRFETAVDGLPPEQLAEVTDWEHREYFQTF
ncbi:glutamine synthetase family protein [Capillimicrobium parvum]|uniref:Gamma-glutamylanilide synthase n=1 Tax=Capillimicrobium parvum TaxID=2884022 RepID=A0A9E6XT95_9ACTN|nr:Gamma-glutamylanilide synthase [Capillimicrobium parvum]